MKKIIFCLLVFIIGCGSCQIRPKKSDYNITACFYAADCLYRNQENPDKSICTDDLKECRVRDRYEYCLNPSHRIDPVDFEKCLLLLNQK